ncbi:MAG: hypothetical protein A2513_00890 [Sulfurimonas sp. RIFOXYD12_FULL_33_39]|uniref:redoxin family protein n=1 Tax=unclassified Sulfurimonas TaxID=2623549 RepID=UPI0008D4F494|nr:MULTISPECIES: redoxin family protein [unclassified Sulfurimonas]OHE10877.1 MAG: hypothetical protein A2513_00890 [Sulfurimonas sp. RIFOXYD12_FULL_33_39]OHE13353.1 MAG: hypothetical protein A2530_07290 [Sulfurimonas sp. RIFOXYD2_FULL_34_21]DAB28049.1 MAG TPA: hypothetical protein CFH78_04540 [Sulfurimonas sp. UBA10385]
MNITVNGVLTRLEGKEIDVGREAPAARITKLDGSKNVIGMIAQNLQLIVSIPSLKTEVCSLGAKKFNKLVEQFKKLETIMVTTDDIEFVKEYVKNENIDSAELVIDADLNFAKKYGLLIKEGKLKNRLARAVYLIDSDGKVAYKELVGEIVDEVDYDACIKAVHKILSEEKKGHTHENWMSV